MIQNILDRREKMLISREILQALPQWFGIPEYDNTNRFYLSLGFQEFEVFPTLWDERNPCQVYVMALR